MDYNYKKKKDCGTVMVAYVSPYASGESVATSATTIYIKADDDTIHAVTLVYKQGKYTLKVNQTPE